MNNLKLKKYPLGLSLCLFVSMLFAVSVNAQLSDVKSELAEKKDPVEITSDRMRSEERGQKIIFSGNVLAVWGELSIRSDVLEIYNHSGKKGDTSGATSFGEGQQLDRIIAIGNVDVRRGDRRAKGNRATYLDKEQQIILRGNPNAVAWEGENVIKGKEMIFFLDSDRFLVNDRVTVKLFPGKANGPKPRVKSRGKTASKPR